VQKNQKGGAFSQANSFMRAGPLLRLLELRGMSRSLIPPFVNYIEPAHVCFIDTFHSICRGLFAVLGAARSSWSRSSHQFTGISWCSCGSVTAADLNQAPPAKCQQKNRC